jgi:hypothetical protein
MQQAKENMTKQELLSYTQKLEASYNRLNENYTELQRSNQHTCQENEYLKLVHPVFISL